MTPRADDTLRYSHDWLGRRVKTELVADNGTTVSRSEEVAFDALGRITGVVNELGSFTSNTVAQKDGAGVVQRRLEWDAEPSRRAGGEMDSRRLPRRGEGAGGAPPNHHRLLAVQNAAGAAAGVKRSEFGYDGQGRRVEQVEKEHDGTDWVTVSHWHYLWDGLELAQKRAAADGTVLVNYYGAGEKHGTDSLVYLSDHLGSARAWYRVSDGEVGTAEYGAFGQRQLLAAGPGEPDRGYTGHLRHAASGLVLAPYRAYDPQLARWLSEDPIMEAGGLNLYGYVGNGPVMRMDPLGLDPYAGFANGPSNPSSDINAFRHRGRQGAGNNVFSFNSPSSLIGALQQLSNITRLDLHGHGIPGAFFTGDPSARIYPPNLDSLAEMIADGRIDMTKGASIRLFACNQDSNAQHLSQKLADLGRGDILVIGASGPVYPNSSETRAHVDRGTFNVYQRGRKVGGSRSISYK